MRKLREDEIRIATEAARWQQTLAGADEKTRAEFADWLKASPRHVREFMFMEALEACAQDVDPERTLEMATDLSGLEERATDIGEFTPARLRKSPARRRFAALAAAVLVCVLAGAALWFAPGGRERYETQVGEQRIVQLPDGSVARLNTLSKMRIRFSDAQREVHLPEGEALFKVAHDPKRPFRVVTADAVIRAVGTEFNVYARARETRVAVVEGKVEVTRPATASAPSKPTQLIAGQTALIRHDTDAVSEKKADIAQTIAWRERRLVFQEETLGEIAAQFNRYNRAPKIVIEGEESSERRYGGSFNADDPQSLVRMVTRSGELQAQRRGDDIVIRRTGLD